MRDCPDCQAVVDGAVCHQCGYAERVIAEPRQPAQRIPHGPMDARVTAEIRQAFSRPKPDPKAWAKKIIRGEAAGTYTYAYGIQCAREALNRQPGEDDE